ncbi:MAG: DMT family transporter [Saprospiraceae bacterium]|nr:DMT family transporter [Saprospiraceae bacterium]
MILLIVCILINSLIGVIFKYFNKFEINNAQAITTNYFVCLLTGSLVLGRFALPSDIMQKDWFWVAVLLGLLFVITFNLMAKTVQHFGVGVATIFQKMSLIAPALLAVFYYGEAAPITKIFGIVLAVLSIVLLSYKKNKSDSPSHHGWVVFLPMTIFLGSCVVDSCLFLVEKESWAPNGDIEFVSALFFFGGVFGLINLIISSFNGKFLFQIKNVVGGFVLGIPNFFSIYLLLLLLAKGWDGSVVFPVNNVGVLIMAAIFGYVLFKERWTKMTVAGFLLACTSIVLIAI